MIKKLTAFPKIILIVFLFIGCQKNRLIIPYQNGSFERNIQLVPDSVARRIAINFNPDIFFNTANPYNHSNYKSKLNGHNQILAEHILNDHSGKPALYIFDFVENQGFLFVSADYQIKPVLAFVERGNFKKENAPGGEIIWLNKTIQNIEIVRKRLYDNTNVAKAAWATYYSRNQPKASNYNRSGSGSSKNTVSPNITQPPPPPPDDPGPCGSDPNYSEYTTYTTGPFVPVQWDQNQSFNDLYPDLSCTETGNGHAPTGCVATAMAQIIFYWQSPVGPYDYSTMSTFTGNTDVQQLMLDVGSSVGMQYSCSGSNPPAENWMIGGILTNESTSERISDAFKVSFGYSSSDYDEKYQGADYQKIQTEIMYHRPVILSGNSGKNAFGQPTGEGHAWVCDGTSSTNYSFCMNGSLVQYTTLNFHMNWGWGGSFNGWFAFNDWTITADTGEDYQYFNELNYNIHP